MSNDRVSNDRVSNDRVTVGTAPVLVAEELVAGYIPEVNILNGCNIVVNAGEFVGIIGPIGSG